MFQPFTGIGRRERDWAHHHDDSLSRRAERAMAKWKMTLNERTRGEIGEPSRRERVHIEINRERSRRTVRQNSGGGTQCATTGLDQSATAVRKVQVGSKADSLRSQVGTDLSGENG